MNIPFLPGNVNPTVLLLVAGVALILINILYGVFRAARGSVKAGWFTVLLALVACILIGVGSVQVALASSGARRTIPGGARFSGTPAAIGTESSTTAAPNSASNANAADPAATPTFARRSGGNGTPGAGGFRRPTATGDAAATSDPAVVATQAATDAATAPATQSDPAATPTFARRTGGNGTPGAGGFRRPTATGDAAATSDPAVVATMAATAAAKAPATQSANDPGATPTFARRTSGNGTPGGAAGGSPTAPISGTGGAAPDANILSPVAAAGGLSIILAIVLFLIERRRPNFSAAGSRGLLNLGAGLFIVVAALVIPMIPGQIAGTSQVAAAAALRSTFAAAPTKVVASATPSPTVAPSATPSALPTLTLTATDAPRIQPTSISYAMAQSTTDSTAAPDLSKVATSGATQCVVNTIHNVNLRPDPSTDKPLLLTVPAGVDLPVSAQSKDKAWWKVSYSDGATTTVGWVSAQYATANSKCSAVPTAQE